MGTSAICSGTTINPTTIMNKTFRPGNCIHAKAYAANAATVMGITTAGMVTAKELANALAKPASRTVE
jgi:hypothetical protein